MEEENDRRRVVSKVILARVNVLRLGILGG